ncbi:MAG: hypothetical protein J6C99_11495 [Lachnospiraceae bacterium]|nr:hypothetical protein [Lachnospiraceae bacterium]
MKQTYYKTALRSLISLSIPTILEEVLSTLLQYVDTAMVGHLGEKATAAVSMWGIRILGTFLCVNVFGLGLKAVWLCMIADNICKAVLLYMFRPRIMDSGDCRIRRQ